METWAAYLAIEPDTGTRIDVQTGIIAASNLWPNQRKGKRKVRPRDLMPRWGRPRKQSSGAHLLAWATAHGAKIDPALAEKLIHGEANC